MSAPVRIFCFENNVAFPFAMISHPTCQLSVIQGQLVDLPGSPEYYRITTRHCKLRLGAGRRRWEEPEGKMDGCRPGRMA